MRFRGRVLMFMLFVTSFRATTVSGQGISSVNDAANIGLPENSVFTGSDFDMVQTNNGYIHVRIPLIDLKGGDSPIPSSSFTTVVPSTKLLRQSRTGMADTPIITPGTSQRVLL